MATQKASIFSPRRPQAGRRRGTILVTAIWASIIMVTVVLTAARAMRVEAQAANNRAGDAQAQAIVKGAEQYVLSLVEAAAGDPTLATEARAENMAVGEGYFWLIRPDPDDPEQMLFGLVDEGSKANLNAMSADELRKLPGVTSDIADAIIDWRDQDNNTTDQGAEKDYYLNLPQPYEAKNERFETIEELRLIIEPKLGDKAKTDEMLFGYDRNRDGVLDNWERDSGGLATGYSSQQGAGRGIVPLLTVWSQENTSTALAAPQGVPANQRADVNGDQNALTQALARVLQQQRAATLVAVARAARPAPQNPPPTFRRFSSVLDFCAAGNMTVQEVKQVYDRLYTLPTGGRTIIGRMNINTATRDTLATLPGLDSSDVDKLLEARSSNTSSSNLVWVYEALGPQKAGPLGARLTSKSYQYTADIVAVTGNGRSFRRVRVVVDGRSTPARIIYRRDLTDLGWPLDPSILEHLRAGGKLEMPYGGGGGSGSGLSDGGSF